jgi:hypothetical protein
LHFPTKTHQNGFWHIQWQYANRGAKCYQTRPCWKTENGCTIKLNKEPVAEYLQSNIALLSSMIEMGYEDKKTIARRIQAMPSVLSCASSMRVGGAIQSSVGRFDWFFSSCATALKCPILKYLSIS